MSTTGWIYNTFTELIGSVSDLVNDLTNNTFGFLKTTDTISQNQIDQTTENGWIAAIYTYVADTYLTKSSASSTYAKKPMQNSLVVFSYFQMLVTTWIIY